MIRLFVVRLEWNVDEGACVGVMPERNGYLLPFFALELALEHCRVLDDQNCYS